MRSLLRRVRVSNRLRSMKKARKLREKRYLEIAALMAHEYPEGTSLYFIAAIMQRSNNS